MIQKNEDHEIYRDQNHKITKKNDPKIVDHKKSQDQDHAITKSGEIRIIRSWQNYSWINFFFASQITRSNYFSYLRSQDHIFCSCLRSRDHIFFSSKITRSFLKSWDRLLLILKLRYNKFVSF